MDISLRTAVISALAVGGALAAASANAQIALPSTGASSLLFFVNDISNGTTYTEVLSQTIGGTAGLFNSTVASTSGGTVGQVNFINGDTFSYNAGANTNLQSFISTAEGAKQTLEWGVYAGATPPSGTGLNKPGGNLAITTATDYKAASGSTPAADPSITAVSTGQLTTSLGTTGLSGDIALLNKNTFDSFGGTSNGIIGTPSSVGANVDLYGAGVAVEAAIGSSAQLFGLTGGGSSSSAALAYDLGTISFNGTTLSLTANGKSPPPVPLPAAVWLLGSGLLGLAGIGRRRREPPARAA